MRRNEQLMMVALAFCLTTPLFMGIPRTANSTLASRQPYDPWVDPDDNGVINIMDILTLALQFGAEGSPINKTAVLLDLQSRVAFLEASMVQLQSALDVVNATLTSRIDDLESQIEDMQLQMMGLQFRLNMLENDVAVMNTSLADLQGRVDALETGGYIGAPAYDSGWLNASTGRTTFTHNMNTTEVVVYLVGRDSNNETHQYCIGGNHLSNYGAYFEGLNSTAIDIYVYGGDLYWQQVRLMIWKTSPIT